MQSWGESSRLQLRRTASAPTKSGILGLILCASGTSREESGARLAELRTLRFGVRIDRPGTRGWDYHTAGAGYGIMSAEGKVKLTGTTRQPETLLSRREYLFDASFVAGLEGPQEIIERIVGWLGDPVWPVFLGRKCCVPTLPVFERALHRTALLEALSMPPSHAGLTGSPRDDLRVLLDASTNEPLPSDARVVYDVPRALGVMEHDPRWVVEATVRPVARLADSLPRGTAVTGGADGWWRRVRLERLAHDQGLCVFCKAEAEEVHHVTYERRGAELLQDLRSLCGACHDACTALEYGSGMTIDRVDPLKPEWRSLIARQLDRARGVGAHRARRRVFDALDSSMRGGFDLERGEIVDVPVLPED